MSNEDYKKGVERGLGGESADSIFDAVGDALGGSAADRRRGWEAGATERAKREAGAAGGSSRRSSSASGPRPPPPPPRLDDVLAAADNERRASAKLQANADRDKQGWANGWAAGPERYNQLASEVVGAQVQRACEQLRKELGVAVTSSTTRKGVELVASAGGVSTRLVLSTWRAGPLDYACFLPSGHSRLNGTPFRRHRLPEGHVYIRLEGPGGASTHLLSRDADPGELASWVKASWRGSQSSTFVLPTGWVALEPDPGLSVGRLLFWLAAVGVGLQLVLGPGFSLWRDGYFDLVELLMHLVPMLVGVVIAGWLVRMGIRHNRRGYTFEPQFI